MSKPMLKKYSVRETSGGFIISLPLLLASLGAAQALKGGISAAVTTGNERAQLQAQKEMERHNKELEKQISGSGVIADFPEKT